MLHPPVALHDHFAAFGTDDVIEDVRLHRWQFYLYDRLHFEQHFGLLAQHLVDQRLHQRRVHLRGGGAVLAVMDKFRFLAATYGFWHGYFAHATPALIVDQGQGELAITQAADVAFTKNAAGDHLHAVGEAS